MWGVFGRNLEGDLLGGGGVDFWMGRDLGDGGFE